MCVLSSIINMGRNILTTILYLDSRKGQNNTQGSYNNGFKQELC